MIDIHNHILIDVDDGPSSTDEALNLLKQAKNNGITDIIVTPHHLSGDFVNPKNKILDEMEYLKNLIQTHGIDINIYPGQEIRINGDILNGLIDNSNLSLNHSNYVLIEFAFSEMPHYAERLFFDLQMKGFTPIIAHPERCRPIKESPNKLYHLIEKGALAQVTANSVTGKLGDGLQELSLNMIKNNLVHIIGSDAHHSEKRPFMLKEAYDVVGTELGKDYVDDLKLNAERILHNKGVKIKAPVKNKSDEKIKRKKFLGLF